MSEKAVFTAKAEILEVPNNGTDKFVNPFLTVARFIFADDRGAPLSTAPAGYLQGIEFEDFDKVIESAINMPVKMNLLGDAVAGHSGSYVIGHITNMEKAVAEDGTNQLIAEAVLYKEEFPEEVEHLKDAHAEGKAPGVSYEVSYGASLFKNGVQWLKDIITCAATFVGSPAYGKRTALLALASAKTDSEFKETLKTLAEAEESKDESTSNKGGKNVEELEKVTKELDTLKAEAETKTSEISRLNEELANANTKITDLEGQINTLHTEKKLETRIRKFTEAGFALEADAEKAKKKTDLWLKLDDDDFDNYLEDLKAASAKRSDDGGFAAASLRGTLPRFTVTSDDSGDNLSFKFRD